MIMAHLIKSLLKTKTFLCSNRKWPNSSLFNTSASKHKCSRSTLLSGLESKKLHVTKRLLYASGCRDCGKTIFKQGTAKYFHTTAARNALPGVVVLLLRPLSKLLAFIVGRGFRKWYQALPKDKKSLVKAYLIRNWKIIGVISGGTVGGCVVYYESHVYETPITMRRRFLLFSDEQFREIADYEFKVHMEEYADDILPTKHPAYNRVLKVANRLLEANKDLKQIYKKQWSVTVVDQDIKNAFVLACGQVFVFTGMLEVCSNDDQLGIILGHEMAHCILSHGSELLSLSHLVDLVLLLPVIAIWALIPSDSVALLSQWLFSKVTEMLLTLPYGRLLEAEADDVGLSLAAKACFDVRESSAFWGKMAALGETIEEGKSQDWFSTHPSHSTRQSYLDKLIPDAILLREKCKCPTLPERDPRDYIPQKVPPPKPAVGRTPVLTR